MNIFDAIILSIVEGISEFLPISSTGHMVLVSHLLGIGQNEFTKSFEIVIQLGAILAVVALYYKTLLTNKHVWTRVLIAFLPTGILGFLLYKIIKHYLLGNVFVTLFSLFIGGVAIIALEKLHTSKTSDLKNIESISYKNAFLIGLFQSISMVPGVSRSAATIVGALLLKADRKTAVEFSFLLAVPTMLAATGLDLLKSRAQFSSSEYVLLGIGTLCSFIVALLAIKFFIKFVQRNTLTPFGIYRIFLSIVYYFLLK